MCYIGLKHGVAEKKKFNILEMRSMCRVTRMEGVRDEEVRSRTGVTRVG